MNALVTSGVVVGEGGAVGDVIYELDNELAVEFGGGVEVGNVEVVDDTGSCT